jgi:DNA-binding transcriptional regulator GbsR (MarR family)
MAGDGRSLIPGLSPFDHVDSAVITLLGRLDNAMGILETFNESQREKLFETLQSVIESFRILQSLARELDGSVPIEVLSLADEGKNPDNFAKNLMKSVDESAQKVQAKEKWMAHFKKSLDGLIEANFPDSDSERNTLLSIVAGE